MITRRSYTEDNDLAQAETMYRIVKWVYDDPDRAIDVGSRLVGLGITILGLACLAAAFKK